MDWRRRRRLHGGRRKSCDRGGLRKGYNTVDDCRQGRRALRKRAHAHKKNNLMLWRWNLPAPDLQIAVLDDVIQVLAGHAGQGEVHDIAVCSVDVVDARDDGYWLSSSLIDAVKLSLCKCVVGDLEEVRPRGACGIIGGLLRHQAFDSRRTTGTRIGAQTTPANGPQANRRRKARDARISGISGIFRKLMNRDTLRTRFLF